MTKPANGITKQWGGPRPNSGGKRAGAGRKPLTIKINVEDARAILNQNMSGELIERLGQFTRKGESKMKTQSKQKEYNVYENDTFVKTVKAASAKNAIRKVENERGGYLFNPFAVNSQDANDNYGNEIDKADAE